MFSASVEEISDSDSQFSFSNEEESSSMHVSAIDWKDNLFVRFTNAILKTNARRRVVFVFQDTNEAEAENTDKESDFNLKVSREPNVPKSSLDFYPPHFTIRMCYQFCRCLAEKRKKKKERRTEDLPRKQQISFFPVPLSFFPLSSFFFSLFFLSAVVFYHPLSFLLVNLE